MDVRGGLWAQEGWWLGSSDLERMGIRCSEGGARAGGVNGSSRGVSLLGARDTC